MGAVAKILFASALIEAVLAAIVCGLAFWIAGPRKRALLAAVVTWALVAYFGVGMIPGSTSYRTFALAIMALPALALYVVMKRVLEMAQEDDAHVAAEQFK